MKNFLYALLLFSGISSFMPTAASGQEWDEWFHQGWALHEYDRREIGALWAFMDRVSAGLEVVGKGLTTISHITNGELNLHRDFFGARKNVNPNINNAIDFIEVIYFQISIVQQMNAVYQRCSRDRNFSADELLYIERVHRNFLILTEANISELLKIIRPTDMSMTDDERMNQIDRIYDDMKDQRAFVNAFASETEMLSRNRQHELNGIMGMRTQYDMF